MGRKTYAVGRISSKGTNQGNQLNEKPKSKKPIRKNNYDDEDKENRDEKRRRRSERIENIRGIEKMDDEQLRVALEGVQAKIQEGLTGDKLERALAPMHEYLRRMTRENNPIKPPAAQSMFRMPEEVVNCDMEGKTYQHDQLRLRAYQLYLKEIERIEPQVRSIVETGLRKRYGSAAFEHHFPDWNRSEHLYNKEFREKLVVYRMALARHYFFLKQVPAFYYDWRGTQDVDTIPGGKRMIGRNNYADVMLWEGTKGSEEIIADYVKRRKYKKEPLPTCNCRGSCGPNSGCACFERVKSLGKRMAVHVNGRLQYLNGRPLGAVMEKLSGENEVIDGFRTPHSHYEHDHPPQAFLCDATCGCPPSCSNRTVLKEGCPAVLAIVNLPGKGLGVLAVDQIERGTYITAYAGEWMTEEQAKRQRRDKTMFAGIPAYSDVVLSPDLYYNIYKFINHACCPNVTMTVVTTDRVLPDFGELTYHARQTIYPGDEIESDYGREYKMFECRCGYRQCRKRLGFD